jgi:hypothetical protein
MSQEAIFLPVSALALLTFTVLSLIPLRRFRAVFSGAVKPDDFRFGESAAVPGAVSIPNRNYMNLLELPVLFYVLAVALYVTDRVDGLFLALAWVYVALRVVHSLVHVSYNHILHRLALFAVSNFVLMAMWLVFVARIWPAAV